MLNDSMREEEWDGVRWRWRGSTLRWRREGGGGIEEKREGIQWSEREREWAGREVVYVLTWNHSSLFLSLVQLSRTIRTRNTNDSVSTYIFFYSISTAYLNPEAHIWTARYLRDLQHCFAPSAHSPTQAHAHTHLPTLTYKLREVSRRWNSELWIPDKLWSFQTSLSFTLSCPSPIICSREREVRYLPFSTGTAFVIVIFFFFCNLLQALCSQL